VGVRTLNIEPGSPWENGYVETFNGKLRDELPNREGLETLLGPWILIERCREHYVMVRPHPALGYRAPTPETTAAGPPSAPFRAALQRRRDAPNSHALWTEQGGNATPGRYTLTRIRDTFSD
jgi:Transposase and inactivated derivatives, IS30 family